MYCLRFLVVEQNWKWFYTMCFIKNHTFFNMNVAVYEHTGKCVGGHTKLFMTLSPALGTGPVSSISYNHPNINYKSSLKIFRALLASASLLDTRTHFSLAHIPTVDPFWAATALAGDFFPHQKIQKLELIIIRLH